MRKFDTYAESESLEVKVPIIFLVTAGFSPPRDGHYGQDAGSNSWQ
jgi:hypothetical protein